MEKSVMTGRDLMTVLAPILGYDDLSAIRSITLHMDYRDVAWMEIDRLADGDPESVEVVEGKASGKERYQITVERVR